MALYKRKGIYYVKIPVQGRKPIRRTTGTKDKRKAQEYHDKWTAELWDEQRLGRKPARTWDEGIVRWMLERQNLPSYVNMKKYVAFWTRHLRGVALIDITRDLVDEKITTHLGHLKNATKDHYVKPVRGMLIEARDEWKWIDNVPKFRTYKQTGEDERLRWLTPEQWRTLFRELPRHLRVIAMFSLATGLRRNNVLRLRKSDVDWVRYVAHVGQPHNRTKNRRPLVVPLNRYAVMALRATWDDAPKSEHVFTYKGQPIKQVNTQAWYKALRRAGIQDFRWHDLRHTWASWLSQEGVDPLRLMELVGWRSLEMVKRYRHLNVHHLAPDASRLDTILDTPEIARQLTGGIKS